MKEYRWRRWVLPLAALCWVGAMAFPLLAVAASYFEWGGTALGLSAVGFLACYVGLFTAMSYGPAHFEEVIEEIRDGLEDGSVVVSREDQVVEEKRPRINAAGAVADALLKVIAGIEEHREEIVEHRRRQLAEAAEQEGDGR